VYFYSVLGEDGYWVAGAQEFEDFLAHMNKYTAGEITYFEYIFP
jgi:hypothetical protein